MERLPFVNDQRRGLSRGHARDGPTGEGSPGQPNAPIIRTVAAAAAPAAPAAETAVGRAVPAARRYDFR
jgi:hypothetical protein